MTKSIRIHPVTPSRWKDVESLFGSRGACAGCRCMLWRLSRQVYEKQKGARNRLALRKLVVGGHKPGLLAYVRGAVAAWCAVAPRSESPTLDRSRVLRPVDSQEVWSITCFFVARAYRRMGLTGRMIHAAVEFVKENGGRIVEAYPIDPGGKYPETFAWTGFLSAFDRVGFREVARRSSKRPVVRFQIS